MYCNCKIYRVCKKKLQPKFACIYCEMNKKGVSSPIDGADVTQCRFEGAFFIDVPAISQDFFEKLTATIFR